MMYPASTLPLLVDIVLYFHLSVPRAPSLWVFHFYISDFVLLYDPVTYVMVYLLPLFPPTLALE